MSDAILNEYENTWRLIKHRLRDAIMSSANAAFGF